ncbi:MAG: hypothetical protein Q7S11_00410 [bacterium]|nr:hypothetical protein [bacterium]
MAKKTYIIIAVVYFLFQIVVLLGGRASAEYSWGETLIRIVFIGSLAYAGYGVMLIARAHMAREKIWPLVVATLLSGFWVVLVSVLTLVSLFSK